MNRWLTTVSISLVLAASGSTAWAVGDAEAGKTKSATCMACHGADGNSPNPIWPSLAGQHAGYLKKQMLDYQSGEQRSNALMAPMIAALSEEDMDDLAAFYTSQKKKEATADPELVALGERIYRAGIPEKEISACIACHGPSGMGNPLANFPRLSGQHAAYSALTIKEFRDGVRRNDLGGMMQDAVARMTNEEIEAVAAYSQGLR